MVSQAGWRVERATVSCGPAGLPQQVFRVSWKGYWQADCATTGEVADHVDLSTLVPTGWAGARIPDQASIAEARALRLAARRLAPADPDAPVGGRLPAVSLRLPPGGRGVAPRSRTP